tara:strand:+ start:1304 stop:1546 length:243 start_codon:yes stop_codon:yes gene_type:complete
MANDDPLQIIRDLAAKKGLTSEEIAIGIGRAILYRFADEPDRISVSHLADAIKGIASFTDAKGEGDGGSEEFLRMFRDEA